MLKFNISINSIVKSVKLINTESELVLKSRNVIPKKLIDAGFIFEFKTIEMTFKSLLK